MNEKEQASHRITKNYMWWSMGAGLIPIPFVDLAAVSGVQIKMISEISKVYGMEFHESRGKAVIASLIGYVVPNALTFGAMGSLLKAVPVVGQLVGGVSMAVFCGASTYAVGKVFVQHFESGGTFLTFDPAKVKEYFMREFEEGRKVAETLQQDKAAEEPAAAGKA
jgi:uncharacterized protein (DUF697 family)